jgi:hypothetical protein
MKLPDDSLASVRSSIRANYFKGAKIGYVQEKMYRTPLMFQRELLKWNG